ncbi:MAG: hypothetical protein GXO78_08285 [Calditrichaeota bacterium]|nr:hypothetical protein [Calditrichota bacterium]
MGKKYRWLQRHWDRFLIGGYIFLIIYTTLVPFRFAKDPQYLLRKLSKIEWRLYFIHQGFYSGADILINVLLFVPLGFFLALHRQFRSLRELRLPDFFWITLQGMLVSGFVESLQIFTYNRHPSASDLFNNTLGTLLGALLFYACAPLLRTRIRPQVLSWFQGRPDNVMAALLVGMVLFVQLAPFDFGLNTHVLARQLRRFLADPWQVNLWFPSEFLVLFLLYAQLAYFLMRGLQQMGSPFLIRFWAGLALLALAVIMELIQFGVPDRRHSVLDVLAGWTAIVYATVHLRANNGNTVNASVVERDRPFFRMMALVYVLLIAYHLFAIPLMHWGDANALENWRYFVDPLAWLLRKDRMMTVVRLMEVATLFFPLGFFARYFLGKRFSRLTLLMGGVVFALMTEGLQIVSLPLAAHWSQIIAGALGMWAGLDFEGFYEELFRTKNAASAPKA